CCRPQRQRASENKASRCTQLLRGSGNARQPKIDDVESSTALASLWVSIKTSSTTIEIHISGTRPNGPIGPASRRLSCCYLQSVFPLQLARYRLSGVRTWYGQSLCYDR